MWNRASFIKFVNVSLFLMLAVPGYGQKSEKPQALASSVIWKINSLKKIGRNVVVVIGDPAVVNTSGGKAVLFDGADDGLLVNSNPIEGASAFTVEAVFRPDPGGGKEQRWLHIQETSGDGRLLLETRLDGDRWFLDTFIKSGDSNRTLYAEDFKHPLGHWYHVALVFDGTEMRHYVDGQLELSGPLAVRPFKTGGVSIGVRMNRVHWFKGAVRRARFTPRALAPKQFMKK
ncbi:MAG: LamG domain-containing protein [Rubrivivax sp.]|nr:LamG domain-containing protein [Pyrinomonadaceae bacterium]